ncbi:MAG: class I SAM-dependent RNA methyltransferase [Comamonadaceae bacterium]|nr:class I SAM-dependent RNA methyltransferase [Comamonadaceae bacterium]
MNQLTLFLPCAAGVEGFLADEVHGITGLTGDDLLTVRAGVRVRTDWEGVLLLNLHCRLAQRVLIELAQGGYRDPEDLYALAHDVCWEAWFTPRQSFRIELTAQHSPLQSLNFATLRIKDGVADRFRRVGGERPSIDTHTPDVRLHAHLTTDTATLYIDTSGEPLFKRGWRQDKGDAPLKETLAAAMLAASGWWQPATRSVLEVPLYDPCCGSGTIVIEAAQIRLGMPAGGQRRFGFEQLRPFNRVRWDAVKKEASLSVKAPESSESVTVFGSDVAHRMVDFAERNAQRAGVSGAVQLRGGDALQRMPPSAQPGVIVMNPPYGERIAAAGVAGRGREAFQSGTLARARAGEGVVDAEADSGDEFFRQLSTHWKSHFAGWTAWMLTPDLKLPGRLRLKESRRVPMWNGPIECRMFRFDLTARGASAKPGTT